MRRQVRGQATVELALGLLVFVGVLICGIHFAEFGVLNLKATEAASAALWDATGRQVHQYAPGTGELLSGKRDGAIKKARNRVQDAYRDFDGRTSKVGSPLSLVFARGARMEVTCEDQNALPSHAPANALDDSERDVIYGNGDHGGVQCRAQAAVELVPGQAPRHLAEGEGGFFETQLFVRNTIPLCSVGRASGGDCKGTVPMLLGDWSLSDTRNGEHNECDLYAGAGCENRAYYAAVNAVYGNVGAGGSAGSALATWATGGSPIDEGKFWMSFKGEESGFQQDLRSVHWGDSSYTVTPGGPYEVVPEYAAAHGARKNCWLGMPCNAY